MAQYSDLPVRLAVVGESGAKQGRDMPGTMARRVLHGEGIQHTCARGTGRYALPRKEYNNVLEGSRPCTLLISLRCSETP